MSDLEYLIEKAVDPSKANYAVFTGVQASGPRWEGYERRKRQTELKRKLSAALSRAAQCCVPLSCAACPACPVLLVLTRLGRSSVVLIIVAKVCHGGFFRPVVLSTRPQIHNWAADVNTDAGAPSLEFISVVGALIDTAAPGYIQTRHRVLLQQATACVGLV
eukprot:1160057-Pelagomonas_calceolata.AAC.3